MSFFENTEEKAVKIHYIIPNILERIIQANKEAKVNDSSCMDYEMPLDLTLKNYLKRIIKYTKTSRNNLIYALCLIDMMCIKNIINLSEKNVYSILLASVVISIKMNDDVLYRDSDYAWIGMLPPKLLSHMERVFLTVLDYNVNVPLELFENYSKVLP